jgi:hypothetical protein
MVRLPSRPRSARARLGWAGIGGRPRTGGIWLATWEKSATPPLGARWPDDCCNCADLERLHTALAEHGEGLTQLRLMFGRLCSDQRRNSVCGYGLDEKQNHAC